jgi:N utilization substance protein A
MTQEITFTGEIMGYIRLFEQVTGAQVKDCLETPEKIIFIVMPGQGSMAIGKGGETATRLRELLKKNVQIIEFADDPKKFLKNIFWSYGVQNVEIEDRGKIIHATVTVKPENKARAIGKHGANLDLARRIVNRHFEVNSVSVA